jgi:alkanesulfonate monooxygenase SsuD/methylene tetrahydromethanopterin reductase-like flavin-dependent oxidoreductase (luciferase family)
VIAPIKISLVDTSPVLASSTAVEAFRTTVELAQLADQAGFSRCWLSELHRVLTNAGATLEDAVTEHHLLIPQSPRPLQASRD